jgi:outer membrane protein assembly factor BamD
MTLGFPARLLALALLAGGCGAHTVQSVDSQGDPLRSAWERIERRDYVQAIETLKPYVEGGGGRAGVDRAIFMLGDAYVRTRQFELGVVEFERLLRDYPESDSAASASYMLGEALFGQSRGPDFDQDHTRQAVEQWQRYLSDYPGHWRNPMAEQKLAEARARLARKLLDTADLYLKLNQVKPARVYYERVVNDYPDTPLSGEALLGVAWTDHLSGRSDDARATIEAIEREYPGTPLASRAAEMRRKIEKEGGRRRPPKPTQNVPDGL